MTHFVDSHAHLADPAFDADRDDVIARAREHGARSIVCIGESLAAAARAQEIARAHESVIHFTAGIHPHDAADFVGQRDLPRIAAHVHDGACAIGECGLDYHYDNAPRTAQRTAFEAQLLLARDLKRPVVVHTRDAEADTRALLARAGEDAVVGVLHCFTGSHALAEDAIAAGWYVSFSGIVTFKKWTDVALLRLVPDNRLLVESDSPYLAPVPHRGKRNEPAWVTHTIERLAEAREVGPETIGDLACANARRLFSIP